MAQQWPGQQQQQPQQMSWSMCQTAYWGMPQYQWNMTSGSTTVSQPISRATNQTYPTITSTTAAQPISVSTSISQQPAIQHSTAAASTNASAASQPPSSMAPQQTWVMGMPLPPTWTLGMPLPPQMNITQPVASIAQPVVASSTSMVYPASGTIVSSNTTQPIQSSSSLTQSIAVSANVTQPITAPPQQPWVIGMPLPTNWTYGMPLPPSISIPPVSGNTNVTLSVAGNAIPSQAITASVSAIQPVQNVVQPVQSAVQPVQSTVQTIQSVQTAQSTNTVNSTQIVVAASTATAPSTSWPPAVTPTPGWQQQPQTNQWSQPIPMYGGYSGWNMPFNMNMSQSFSWQANQPPPMINSSMTQTSTQNTSVPLPLNNSMNMAQPNQANISMVQSWSMTQNTQVQNPANGLQPPAMKGMGMSLLQKMGWNPGEGLGKNKEGLVAPLELNMQWDKRGLITNQELQQAADKYKKKHNYINRKILQQNASIIKKNKKKKKKKSKDSDSDNLLSAKKLPVLTVEGKHPVSLLGEYCLKYKYNAPVYELVSEDGPPHQKLYCFKVSVNDQIYQPSIGSQTKKTAKIEAAQLCLQSLGIV